MTRFIRRTAGSGLSLSLLVAALAATGCSSSKNSESPADGGNPGSADAGSLYDRLGEHAGIRSALDAIVTVELMNSDIASYFFFQSGAPANGHPTEDQVEECLTDQLGEAAGGPETYPTTVTTDAGSWTCRDMVTIHAPLLISGGTFDEFVMIAANELMTLKVASADINTIGTVLDGTKTGVVTTSLFDAGLEPFPGDAATAGQ